MLRSRVPESRGSHVFGVTRNCRYFFQSCWACTVFRSQRCGEIHCVFGEVDIIAEDNAGKGVLVTGRSLGCRVEMKSEFLRERLVIVYAQLRVTSPCPPPYTHQIFPRAQVTKLQPLLPAAWFSKSSHTGTQPGLFVRVLCRSAAEL